MCRLPLSFITYSLLQQQLLVRLQIKGKFSILTPSLKRSVWKARPRATCIEVSLLRTDLTAAVDGVEGQSWLGSGNSDCL